MKVYYLTRFITFLMVFDFIMSNAVLAQNEQDILFKARNRSNLVPYGQILQKVEKTWNGQVVGQSIQQTGPDQWVYDLRILQAQGKLIRVMVDAQTGRLIFFTGGQ